MLTIMRRTVAHGKLIVKMTTMLEFFMLLWYLMKSTILFLKRMWRVEQTRKAHKGATNGTFFASFKTGTVR